MLERVGQSLSEELRIDRHLDGAKPGQPDPAPIGSHAIGQHGGDQVTRADTRGSERGGPIEGAPVELIVCVNRPVNLLDERALALLLRHCVDQEGKRGLEVHDSPCGH
jgi:hypothetical protein